ncbi:hypothetical protein J1614_003519 [Plenodomus biglobosus]|nr:hypothetical protein J1614_003519 [Plenodomus biglobosus]
MLLIIQTTIFYGTEQTTSFEQVPDLKKVSTEWNAKNTKERTRTPTDHMSTLESHSIPIIISGAR